MTLFPLAARMCALLVLALAVPNAISAQNLGAVEGRVLDFQGDVFIAGARVELLDARERRLSATFADSAGVFSFAGLRPGTYRLRAQSLGYRQAITPEIQVAGEPLDVIVRLAADAVLLAPLEVVTRAPPPRAHTNVELAGFYERSQRKLGGTFIMREDIDARNPFKVTDLLKTVGSLTVVSEMLVNMRCNGAPPVYLDGRRISGGGGGAAAYEVVNSIDPSTLEGVEVYAGPATLPAQYAAFTGGCGAILLWSRRGPAPGGGGARQ
jgi:hypothetical protein